MKNSPASLKTQLQHGEEPADALARVVTTPEYLSASLLTICQNIDHAQVTQLANELHRQTAAIRENDLSRVEDMLTAQAHTLDGLFARLTSNALSSNDIDKMERLMKLALKAQSQARATLQTLSEFKAPKQIAFVQQANIGNQVQVNNDSAPARSRAEKPQKAPNELLEVTHEQRLDTRAKNPSSRTDSTMAPVGEKHRAGQR